MAQIRFLGDEPREVVLPSGARATVDPDQLFTVPDEASESYESQPHFYRREDAESVPSRKTKKD